MDHDTMMTMTSSATMTGTAAMASATMDMSSSSSSSSSTMMTSADMAMVFFQRVTTPLYSLAWTPTSEGSYAGTCIFLIMLGVAHRILIAFRSALLYSKSELGQVVSKEPFINDDAYYRNSPESVGNRLRSHWIGHPFRVATETTRAVLEVIISGAGYLLMLAVMTMNIGYFLSVLGGIFLGTFIAGRFELGHEGH
ncbi:Ctr copper transporter family-domain-containing protein [Biscogniauxia sp. FL1348]|nr:Ctr copper transporter family-domain-containing protein [Biscogniauxia sp. FL1348]